MKKSTTTVRYVVVAAIAAVVLSGLLVVAIASIIDAHTLHEDKYEITDYHVCTGDTLWNIASRYVANGDDVRVWILAVEKLNNIDNGNSLCAGTIIKIYAAKGE